MGPGEGLGVRLDYYEDVMPRGPAGCLRDAALRSDADIFVVVDGTVVTQVDLEAVLQAHAGMEADLTVVVSRTGRRSGGGGRQPGADGYLRGLAEGPRPRLGPGLPGHQRDAYPQPLPRGSASHAVHRAGRQQPASVRHGLVSGRQQLGGRVGLPAAGTVRGLPPSGRGAHPQLGTGGSHGVPAWTRPGRSRLYHRGGT